MRAASSPAKGADGALLRKNESMLIRLSENGFRLRDQSFGEGQFDLHREMVRRRAGPGRASRCRRAPSVAVGVGQDAVAQHPETSASRRRSRCDRNVLRSGSKPFSVPVSGIAESPPGRNASYSKSRIAQHGVALARFADVEIAREHGALAAAHRPNADRPPADSFRPAHARPL